MTGGRIRPIALCLFEHDHRMLVAEYNEPPSGVFYRPLGGAIDFGELGQDCVTREIQEEVGAEITDLKFLGALENIFTYEGDLGHEIALVYRARFVDPSIYELDSLPCRDDGGEFPAVWKSLSELREGPEPLYPPGILDLVQATGG